LIKMLMLVLVPLCWAKSCTDSSNVASVLENFGVFPYTSFMFYWRVFPTTNYIYQVGGYYDGSRSNLILTKSDLNLRVVTSFSYPVNPQFGSFSISDDENYLYFCQLENNNELMFEINTNDLQINRVFNMSTGVEFLNFNRIKSNDFFFGAKYNGFNWVWKSKEPDAAMFWIRHSSGVIVYNFIPLSNDNLFFGVADTNYYFMNMNMSNSGAQTWAKEVQWSNSDCSQAASDSIVSKDGLYIYTAINFDASVIFYNIIISDGVPRIQILFSSSNINYIILLNPLTSIILKEFEVNNAVIYGLNQAFIGSSEYIYFWRFSSNTSSLYSARSYPSEIEKISHINTGGVSWGNISSTYLLQNPGSAVATTYDGQISPTLITNTVIQTDVTSN